jgi:hypothetical protein
MTSTPALVTQNKTSAKEDDTLDMLNANPKDSEYRKQFINCK